MDKNEILKNLKSYERAEAYRQKAEDKQDYWWDKKSVAYEKVVSSLSLKRGESIVIGDYLFYKEENYPHNIKIKKPKKL